MYGTKPQTTLSLMHLEPTTQRELRGFYSFTVAMEGYGAMGIAILYPLLLEGLASQVGVELSNPKLPCDLNAVPKHCAVQIGGTLIPTDSIVFYSTTVSVLCQFVLFMSLGALADHGAYRKTFMVLLAYLTCVLGLCLLFVYKSSLWWLSFVIYIISNTSYGAAHVFYYAYVPLLTRNHPEVLGAHKGSLSLYHKEAERVGNDISARSFAYGFLTAVVQLILVAGFLLYFGDGKKYGLHSFYGMQIGVAFAGLWGIVILLAFTEPWLSTRPGPPLPKGENYLFYSYKMLFRTLKRASSLPELFKFLGGWFIYSDGFSTLVSVAILFAQTELGASQMLLLLAGIVTPLAAGLGNFFWKWFQSRMHLSTREILLIHVVMYSLLPIYALVFMKSSAELLPVAAYHGFLLGGTSNSCRVLFSELLPPGYESEFFSLYEITDKGSAWIGPLVVGAISNATGNIRNANYFLLAFLLLPGLFFYSIDMNKGRRQAHAFDDAHK
ncbi:autophagy-related protein 22-like protein [Gorgonomyces haynaldii]|nr:autophagy-related protein 22-like protein [Gorgonomyces haynaldii]